MIGFLPSFNSWLSCANVFDTSKNEVHLKRVFYRRLFCKQEISCLVMLKFTWMPWINLMSPWMKKGVYMYRKWKFSSSKNRVVEIVRKFIHVQVLFTCENRSRDRKSARECTKQTTTVTMVEEDSLTTIASSSENRIALWEVDTAKKLFKLKATHEARHVSGQTFGSLCWEKNSIRDVCSALWDAEIAGLGMGGLDVMVASLDSRALKTLRLLLLRLKGWLCWNVMVKSICWKWTRWGAILLPSHIMNCCHSDMVQYPLSKFL